MDRVYTTTMWLIYGFVLAKSLQGCTIAGIAKVRQTRGKILFAEEDPISSFAHTVIMESTPKNAAFKIKVIELAVNEENRATAS